MKKTRLIVALLAFLHQSAIAGGGGGGFAGATEATQIMNNVELVSQVTESMTQTATQLNQLMQLEQMLTTLPANVLSELGIPVSQFTSAMEMAGNVSAAISTGQAVMGDLGRFRGIVQGYERRANLSNQDLLGYVQGEVTRQVQTGRGLDVERGVERQVMENVKSNWANHQAMMSRVAGTQGVRDGMQLLNGSMGNVIGSIDNLTTLMTSMHRMSSQELDYQRELREQMARNAVNATSNRAQREQREGNLSQILRTPNVRIQR